MEMPGHIQVARRVIASHPTTGNDFHDRIRDLTGRGRLAEGVQAVLQQDRTGHETLDARAERSMDAQLRKLADGNDGIRGEIKGPMERGLQSSPAIDRHRRATSLPINTSLRIQEPNYDARRAGLRKLDRPLLKRCELRITPPEDFASGCRSIGGWRYLLEEHREFRRIAKVCHVLPHLINHLGRRRQSVTGEISTDLKTIGVPGRGDGGLHILHRNLETCNTHLLIVTTLAPIASPRLSLTAVMTSARPAQWIWSPLAQGPPGSHRRVGDAKRRLYDRVTSHQIASHRIASHRGPLPRQPQPVMTLIAVLAISRISVIRS